MSAGVGSQYYSGFNPLVFGHRCSLWLDSADSNTLTVASGRASQWRDKSGSGNDASQNTFALQPTYTTVAAGVSFTITRTTVMQLPAGSIWSSNDPLSIFFVVTPQSNSATNVYLFQGNASGDPSTWAALGLYTTGTQYADYWQGSASATWGTMTVNTTDVTSYIYAQNSTVTAYTNGNSNYSRAQGAYTVSNSPAFLGGEPLRNLYSTCAIREVIIYRAALSDSERQQVEGYLARKWSLLATRFTNIHPYFSISPVTRLFQPIDICGCALWLDAADPSTLTLSGSNVTRWADKSGNVRDASGGVSPTYSSNAVQFAGSSYLATTVPAGSNNASYFVVFNATNTSTAAALIGGNALSTAVIYLNLSTLTLGDWNTAVAANPTTLSAGTTYLASGIASSGTLSLGINGGSLTSGSATFSGTGTFTIGAGYTDNRFKYSGSLYEVLAYSNTLTTTQRQQVEGYLMRKWGLSSNIPSTHPFSTVLPGTVSFNPRNVPGCALWLDAADRGRFTLSGSNVTLWGDKSGNRRDASGGVSPLLSNNSVVFNGTTQYLPTTYTAVPTAETVFVVATNTGATARNYFMFGTATANGRGYQVNVTSGVYTVNWDRSTVARYAATGGIAQNVRFLTSGLFTGTGGSTGVNGGSQSATATFSFAGTGTTAIGGAGNTAGTFWQGSINEIVIYNRVLNTTERWQVEGYLAQKWGLRNNLPSTHPNKKISPI